MNILYQMFGRGGAEGLLKGRTPAMAKAGITQHFHFQGTDGNSFYEMLRNGGADAIYRATREGVRMVHSKGVV